MHSSITPSKLHDDISKDDIEYLEPIMAYHEYYLAFHNEDLTFKDLILFSIYQVKDALLTKFFPQCNLTDSFEPLETQPPESTVDKNTDHYENTQPITQDFLLKMKYRDILKLDPLIIMKYLQFLAEIRSKILPDNFATTTSLAEQYEVLTYNLVELHVLRSKPKLKEQTSDIEIKSWDKIQISFEYFMFYHTGKPFDSLIFFNIEQEKIRDDIMIARDNLLMHEKNEDTTDSRDILDSLFIPETNTPLVCEEKYNLSAVYTNTINFHQENKNLSMNDKDADILSLLGVLHEDAMDNLQLDAMKLFVSAVYRYDGVRDYEAMIKSKKMAN